MEAHELMPCSLNDFQEATGLQDPELLVEFSKALNIYRLAVAEEKKRRWPINL